MLLQLSMTTLAAQAASQEQLLSHYKQDLVPLFKKYCYDCHGKVQAKGSIDLESIAANWASLRAEHHLLDDSMHLIIDGDMPPPKAPQPSEAEREQMIGWLKAYADHLARANAGDPGPVSLRRLTSTEYVSTISKLTGLDLDIASLLPPDAAGGEGFANVGSVQSMTDAVLGKYLQVAKKIVSHARISPVLGITFAEKPLPPEHKNVVREAMDRIQSFYDAAYERFRIIEVGEFREGSLVGSVLFHRELLLASWRRLHADKLGLGSASSADFARAAGLHPKAFEDNWQLMHQGGERPELFGAVLQYLKQLPAPSSPDDHSPAAIVEKIHQTSYTIPLTWDELAGNGKNSGKKGRTSTVLQYPLSSKLTNNRVHLHLKNAANSAKSATVKINLSNGLGVMLDDIDPSVIVKVVKPQAKPAAAGQPQANPEKTYRSNPTARKRQR